MNNYLIKISCIVLLLSCGTSCYHMPTDDDFSLIPSTNNPDYTREKAKSPTPSVPY